MPPNRKKILIICGILVVLGFLSVPLYHHVKVLRARHLAREALVLLGNEETLLEAWEKGQAAYNLVPGDYNTVRSLALILSRGDPAQAQPFWEKALLLSDGSPHDRLKLVEVALALKKFPLAEEHLSILKTETPRDPEYLHLQSRLYLGQNKLEKALDTAALMLELDNIPDKAHLYYVQLSQLSRSPEIRKTGVDHLWSLAGRKDELGLSALKNLARFSGRDPETTPSLIQLLAEHPKSRLEEKLLQLELKLTLPGAMAAELIPKAEEELDLKEPAKKVEFARWLNGKRLYEHTLKIVDEQSAMSRKDMFLVWIDAMAVLNQWDEIGHVLERPGIPVEAYLLHLFKMRAFRARDQIARADLEWEKALLASVGEPKKLWFLVNYSTRLNLPHYVRSALERLTAFPSSMRDAFEKLLLLERDLGKTRELLALAQRMEEIYSNDPAIANDIAYLSVLLNEDLENSVQKARNLVENNPNYLAHRVTLALGYLRMGNPSAALQLFDGITLKKLNIPNQWRPLFVAVLRANGLVIQADELQRGTNTESLLPEERALLTPSQ